MVLLSLKVPACLHPLQPDTGMSSYAQGVAVVQSDDGSEDFTGNHTFIVHEGRDGKRLHGTGVSGSTISLELLACPGYYVTAPSVVPNSSSGQQGAGCGISDDTWADDPYICPHMLAGAGTDMCRGPHAGAVGMQCAPTTGSPRFQPRLHSAH